MGKEYVGWVSLGCTILGFVIMYLKYSFQIETRLVALETKMELFWRSVSPVLKEAMKQPIHYRKDDLIDRFPNISDDELLELQCILLKEVEEYSKTKDFKALAGGMFLSQIEDELNKRRMTTCSSYQSGFWRLLCRLFHLRIS